MKYVYNRITLDVDDMTSQLSLSLKQGDSARGVIVTLVKDGKLFEIANDCYATFSAKRGNGTFVSNGCVVKDNKIIYEYSEEFIYSSGKLDCDFTVYDSENKKITSPMFSAFIYGTAMEEYADEVVNSSSFTILDNLIAEATEVIAQVEQTEDNVSEAEKAREEAETAREQRVDAITEDLENGNIVAEYANGAKYVETDLDDGESGKAFLFSNTNGIGLRGTKGLWRFWSYQNDGDDGDGEYYVALVPSYPYKQFLGNGSNPIKRIYTGELGTTNYPVNKAYINTLYGADGKAVFGSTLTKFTNNLTESGYYYFEVVYGGQVISFGLAFWNNQKEITLGSVYCPASKAYDVLLKIKADGSYSFMTYATGTDSYTTDMSGECTLYYSRVWSA